MASFNKVARNSVLQRVLEIAQRCKEPSSVTARQSRALEKPAALQDVMIPGVATTIKLLASFEWPAPLSTRTATSLCSFMTDATQKSAPRSARRESHRRVYNSNDVRHWLECGIVPEDLLGLIRKVKEDGHTPSREVYTEVLKVGMCVSHSSDAAHHPPAVVKLLKLMCEDHGKAAGLQGLYSSALFLASDESQVEAIWNRLSETKVDFSKGDSQRLMESYISALCQGRPKQAVNRFMRRVVPNSTSLSVFTFERLLGECLRHSQLSRGINTYTCMIRTSGIAPSEKAYKLITSLLSKHADNDLVTLQLCQRILHDSEVAYNMDPPLWVYSRMAMPLILLAGIHGYKHMMNLTRQTAHKYIQQRKYCYPVGRFMSPEVATLTFIRQSWNTTVFHSLLKRTINMEDASLTLHLFGEMKSLDVPVTRRSYHLLLQAVHRHEDLDRYLSVLLQEPEITEEAAGWLLKPLNRALERVLHRHRDYMWHSRERCVINGGSLERVLLLSAHEQIKSALSGTSHQYCLDHISNLGHRVAGRTVSQMEQPIGNSEIEQKVAL